MTKIYFEMKNRLNVEERMYRMHEEMASEKFPEIHDSAIGRLVGEIAGFNYSGSVHPGRAIANADIAIDEPFFWHARRRRFEYHGEIVEVARELDVVTFENPDLVRTANLYRFELLHRHRVSLEKAIPVKMGWEDFVRCMKSYDRLIGDGHYAERLDL